MSRRRGENGSWQSSCGWRGRNSLIFHRRGWDGSSSAGIVSAVTLMLPPAPRSESASPPSARRPPPPASLVFGVHITPKHAASSVVQPPNSLRRAPCATAEGLREGRRSQSACASRLRTRGGFCAFRVVPPRSARGALGAPVFKES